MPQDLRTLATALVDTGTAGTAGGFLVESAWGDLLTAATGVPRMQLAAVLTRHRPTLLPAPATGADVAAAVERLRADVVTTAARSTTATADDLDARLDRALANLRTLGDLGSPATPAPTATPTWPTRPAWDTAPPVPVQDAAGPVRDAAPGPTDDLARRAELQRTATAMRALLGKAARMPALLAPEPPGDAPPSTWLPEPPAATSRRPGARNNRSKRFSLAVFMLAVAYAVTMALTTAVDLHNPVVFGACLAVAVLGGAVVRVRALRLILLALPGPLLLTDTGRFDAVPASLVTVAGMAYVFGYVVVCWRRAKARR